MADESLSIYDEIEIEDMTYDPNLQIYHFPCPCGDRFEIFIGDLRDGEDIAVCPSCSLMIRVIFDVVCTLPVDFFEKSLLSFFLFSRVVLVANVVDCCSLTFQTTTHSRRVARWLFKHKKV